MGNLIKVNIGGSNRKLNKHTSLLREKFGAEAKIMPGTRSLGMHHSCQSAYIPNTDENIVWARSKGMTISKNQ